MNDNENDNCFHNLDIEFINNILKVLPTNIFYKDKDCKYVFATHYWNHLDKDDSAWSIKGKTDLEIRVDKENALKAMEQDKKVLETGIPARYMLKEKDEAGNDQYLEIIKHPVRDKNDEIIGLVGIIIDLTERVELENKLERLANRDQLTGLYNRSYLYRWIKEKNNESLYPLTLIFSDCNGLKNINDNYGHLVGDLYIKETANLLTENLPKNSLNFRMGGDEFLSIIPNTNEEEAKKYTYELEKLGKNKIVNSIKLSVAFGSTCINEFNDNIMKYVNEADNEMYKNKDRMHKEELED